MRDDWDRRAREDASYYVAFGRRRQTAEEFFASAADVLQLLRGEFGRIRTGRPLAECSAVEIGCGPGRLLLPLSQQLAHVTGFDVSPQMVQLARENLRGRPNAKAQQCAGADLPGIAGGSVDFVYSYAVFQHIPDAAPVWSYLRESVRVLRPGGALVCQVHGLQAGAGEPLAARPGWSSRACVDDAFVGDLGPANPDTWSGVRLSPEQLAAFCAESHMELLEFRGIATQYLWMVARKPLAAPHSPARPAIARVTNAYTSDTVIPRSGVFSSATLWVRGLPAGLDLNALTVRIGATDTAPCYVGEPREGHPQQVNVFLPPGLRTGLLPIVLLADGIPISPATTIRIGPAPPLAPRLIRMSDGVNLLDHGQVMGETLKLQIEELRVPSLADARARSEFLLNGMPLELEDALCIDPRLRLFEFNLKLPEGQTAGPAVLEFKLGDQRLPPVGLHVVR